MSKRTHTTNYLGEKFGYALVYMHFGWEEKEFGNSLKELNSLAEEMIENNSGRPLVAINENNEVVREYADRTSKPLISLPIK